MERNSQFPLIDNFADRRWAAFTVPVSGGDEEFIKELFNGDERYVLFVPRNWTWGINKFTRRTTSKLHFKKGYKYKFYLCGRSYIPEIPYFEIRVNLRLAKSNGQQPPLDLAQTGFLPLTDQYQKIQLEFLAKEDIENGFAYFDIWPDESLTVQEKTAGTYVSWICVEEESQVPTYRSLFTENMYQGRLSTFLIQTRGYDELIRTPINKNMENWKIKIPAKYQSNSNYVIRKQPMQLKGGRTYRIEVAAKGDISSKLQLSFYDESKSGRPLEIAYTEWFALGEQYKLYSLTFTPEKNHLDATGCFKVNINNAMNPVYVDFIDVKINQV
ncbi:carbohydrate binding domain-containing protein [Bacillus thuringiensis]|uniref:carbohydrate binding domain-containing protein n=1 Tax=Bacillus thuringiensis TaxID=1428 RepID=UPI000E508FE0|nr:carbohydrate binding domain-containing protein [Bacillus thuringiensis]MDZ3952387.1 carbohydrate binding domain-containing protein [Bacillus thuringiensis]RGP45213.1 hypothetical protein BTW32_25950 [Bacillus thuringiensis]